MWVQTGPCVLTHPANVGADGAPCPLYLVLCLWQLLVAPFVLSWVFLLRCVQMLLWGPWEWEVQVVWGVLLGPVLLRGRGARDWAEGELELWCSHDRGRSPFHQPHEGLWSWDGPGEMGLSLWVPARSVIRCGPAQGGL